MERNADGANSALRTIFLALLHPLDRSRPVSPAAESHVAQSFPRTWRKSTRWSNALSNAPSNAPSNVGVKANRSRAWKPSRDSNGGSTCTFNEVHHDENNKDAAMNMERFDAKKYIGGKYNSRHMLVRKHPKHSEMLFHVKP